MRRPAPDLRPDRGAGAADAAAGSLRRDLAAGGAGQWCGSGRHAARGSPAGGLAIARSHWEELHLRLPAGGQRQLDGEAHVLLARDGDWRWRIDEATQTLVLDAPAAAFLGQRLELAAEMPRVTEPALWAPYLNYDAQVQTRQGSRTAADALWELGLMSPQGDLSSTQLSRRGGGMTRLDTRWQRDDPQRLTRWRLGDSISHAGSWGRALRYGGVQWGTDFSLQPGFLSFPCPR